MYVFSYDYVEPKYGEKSKLCYMDTYSFIVYIKTDGTYKDIAKDIETWFDIQIVNQIDHYQKKKQKSNRIYEIWNRWKNHDKICLTKSKNL